MTAALAPCPAARAAAGRPIAAKHIDHGFYRLTAAQARSLCVDGELPRDGYEKRALPAAALRERLTLLYWRSNGPIIGGGKWQPREASRPIPDGSQCWIKRTALSWHDGATVRDGWTWAIHIWEP